MLLFSMQIRLSSVLSVSPSTIFLLYKLPPPKAPAGKMEEKGQLMGVPIKLVMALVIGTMVMGVSLGMYNTDGEGSAVCNI